MAIVNGLKVRPPRVTRFTIATANRAVPTIRFVYLATFIRSNPKHFGF